MRKAHFLVHLARLLSLTGIPTYVCERTSDQDINRSRVIHMGVLPINMPVTRVMPWSNPSDVLFDLHTQGISYDG